MTKNEIFAQTLLHMVKQQNNMGMVKKCYMVNVLRVYRTYLPKIINVALKFAKNIVKKIYCLFFVDIVL